MEQGNIILQLQFCFALCLVNPVAAAFPFVLLCLYRPRICVFLNIENNHMLCSYPQPDRIHMFTCVCYWILDIRHKSCNSKVFK